MVTRRKTTTLFVFLVMGIFFLSVSAAYGQDTVPPGSTDNSTEIKADIGPEKRDLDQAAPPVKKADGEDKFKGEVPDKGTAVLDSADEESEEDEEFEETLDTIADPIQPFNRLMFEVNDKLYFYVLKPIAQVYGAILPEPARVSVRNFISNLRTPVRLVNCLLQGKFEGAAIEYSRFMVNTTAGILGLFDVAKKYSNLEKQDEDFGQTLGFYGVGAGFYIVWPAYGPSTARDTVGMAADFFVHPQVYIDPDTDLGVAKVNSIIPTVITATNMVNETSLSIGKYEEFKESAIDPYISMRNAYIEHRKSKIKK
ncbi:MAG: VacJ family lipoprotein [Deltaproteobacteria bacterium]|nr:VacJ family lipoprotein [Deltaproteobacteria bacterium]